MGHMLLGFADSVLPWGVHSGLCNTKNSAPLRQTKSSGSHTSERKLASGSCKACLD